ncbi:hypothetical protein ACLB2K_004826 [Fragaria x ananassa]
MMSKRNGGFASSRDRRMNKREEGSMASGQKDLIDVPNPASGFSYKKKGPTPFDMCPACRALLRDMGLKDKFLLLSEKIHTWGQHKKRSGAGPEPLEFPLQPVRAECQGWHGLCLPMVRFANLTLGYIPARYAVSKELLE